MADRLRDELAAELIEALRRPDKSWGGIDYPSLVDALLPTVRREIDQARAEERERIAQAIERDGFDPGKYTLSHPFGNTLRVMRLVRDDCARIARVRTREGR